MVRLDNILVATDFGNPSAAVLTYGRELARTFGATLHVLHVADNVMAAVGADYWGANFPEMQQEVEDLAMQRLEAMVTAAHDDAVQVKPVVRSGSAAAVIVDYAQHEQIGLVVIGTHGRSGISRVLIGSVAERVVRMAPCPVLTVRHPEREFVAEDDHAGAEPQPACEWQPQLGGAL
jgi:nucleotide-binding universal stress UspA family protein